MTGPALLLEDVGVRYGDVRAVDDVSATVGVGRWVALIGPNGAGKSTLLRAVAGLAAHTGAVTVLGEPTAGLSWRRRAQLVAHVPQRPEVPAGMTVLEYALLGRTPHLGPLQSETAADVRRCRDVLARLDLAGLADRSLGQVSGGELQRAVLARVLAQEARVLLLDEPTSSLDVGRRVEVLQIVDGLRREHGLTVVSVLHDLTLAALFADDLLLLADGRLVRSGPPAAVLEATVLQRWFGDHLDVLHDADGVPHVVPARRPAAVAQATGRPA